eukprot:COSAG02_NODE_547_length_20492_cov_265.508802_19_plen_44_part_00
MTTASAGLCPRICVEIRGVFVCLMTKRGVIIHIPKTGRICMAY